MVRDATLESEVPLVRFPEGAYISNMSFRLLPVAHTSAKPMQIKSSMAFIQSKGCKEIDLIFTNMVAVYMTICQFKFH